MASIYANLLEQKKACRFKSHRNGLGHKHGHRFIVLGHKYGRHDVMWKHTILGIGCDYTCRYSMTHGTSLFLFFLIIFSVSLFSSKLWYSNFRWKNIIDIFLVVIATSTGVIREPFCRFRLTSVILRYQVHKRFYFMCDEILSFLSYTFITKYLEREIFMIETKWPYK